MPERPSIYLDHAATTPLDPRVLEAMLPVLRNEFGNPSSLHSRGRAARVIVEECRESVAAHLGAEPSEIVFTSGGTEANNAAIRGVTAALGSSGRIGVPASEHDSVLRTAEALRSTGWNDLKLTVDELGRVPDSVMKCALEEQVAVVSIMHVNNEIGTINDVALYARLCRERGVLIHTDAVQSAGHLELDVRKLGVDLLTLSGHKFYGPKGVGLLYVRAGTPFDPVLTGGAQERGRRSGTEDVAAIVGLSRALALACDERAARSSHLRRLQARLMDALKGEFRGAVRINTPDQSDIAAPHIVSIAIPPVGGKGVDAEMLLLAMDLDGINVSSGSACASGSMTPSHVLSAIGLDEPTAAASLRFSFGLSNSEEDVDYAVERLGVVLRRMGITDSGTRSADQVPG